MTPGPFFSVFTPAFNRRDLLPRVYASLQQQTAVDFEWLVVDDGSTDGTESLVRDWVSRETRFPIVYQFKTNGGKASAYRAAVASARGYALVTVDSDDWLVPEALATLRSEWDSLDEQANVVGVCGLFQFEDGSVVGDAFPQDRVLDTPIGLRHVMRLRGDKIGFNRLDVLRAFPFPDTGERFTPESVVWNRIGQRYKTLFVNRVIGVKEYQAHGLTAGAGDNSLRFPGGYFLLHSELVDGDIPLSTASVLRSLITAQKCSLYSGRGPFVPRRFGHKLLTILLLPALIASLLRDCGRRVARSRGRLRR